MTAELRPCAALGLSPARSRQVGPTELDDHSGPDTDALGPRSGKTADDTSLHLATTKYLPPARPARGNPGQSPRCRQTLNWTVNATLSGRIY